MTVLIFSRYLPSISHKTAWANSKRRAGSETDQGLQVPLEQLLGNGHLKIGLSESVTKLSDAPSTPTLMSHLTVLVQNRRLPSQGTQSCY